MHTLLVTIPCHRNFVTMPPYSLTRRSGRWARSGGVGAVTLHRSRSIATTHAAADDDDDATDDGDGDSDSADTDEHSSAVDDDDDESTPASNPLTCCGSTAATASTTPPSHSTKLPMSVLMATQHWAKAARCECHRRSRFVCRTQR